VAQAILASNTHVERVINKDHGHNCATESVVRSSTNFMPSRENGPHNKCSGHADCANQHDLAPAEEIDEEGEDSIDDQRPGPQTAIDTKLSLRILDANVLQNEAHVVANEATTGPLLEETHGNHEHDSLSVARCA
jgi:hypothetical protein